MKRMLMLSAAITVACFATYSLRAEDEDAAPKYEIADVMQKAMKGGLAAKVAKGEASDEEKKDLLDMFTALAKHKPPQGPERAWTGRTKALIEAASEAVEGKTSASAKLQKAVNCKACHEAHKPA